MSKRAAQYVSADLKRLARRQITTLKKRQPRAQRIPEAEQLRRFEEGAELWRVEAGLVTPDDYDRYVAAMTARLQEG